MKSKIIKNASWIVFCKVAQSVCALIVTMITARYLGPSNYGLINYAASIVAFVIPIVQLGLGNIQVQELINNPKEEGEIIGTTLFLSFLMAIISSLGISAFICVANRGETETIIVCLLYNIILFFQGADLMQYWFQSKYLSKYSSISSLIAYIIVSVYKIYLLVTGKNIYWFAISNAFDYLLILLMLLIIYKKLGGNKLSISKIVAKRMLSKSKYYIITNLMVIIFTQTDRIMLKIMINDAATGYYTAAVSCAGMANFFFMAIIDSARPTIFKYYKISKEKFENSISMLFSVIIYLSFIMCVCMTIFSKYFIYIIYGQAYTSAILPLQIVVWFTIFSYVGNIRNIWILAESKQHLLWKINLAGALSNVAMNFFFIPIWGIIGAAIASLFSQLFTNVIVSAFIKDTRKSMVLMLKGLNPKLILNYLKKTY